MTDGRSVGAFFDLDGTLLPPPSLERRFIAYLLQRRVLRVTSLVGWVMDVLENAPIGTPFAEADRSYLAGLSASLADQWLADRRAPLPFFAEGLRTLEQHAALGHRVFIISGTLAPLARAVARKLPGEPEVCATELKTYESRARNGSGTPLWTGRLAGEWLNGAAKACAVHSLGARCELELSRSFAYGDSAGDVAMLAAVGNPRAVNPAFGLRRVARTRRWQVERWNQRTAIARDCVTNSALATYPERER
jgi:HAD superfamily phosphoserine phosphatase-like hydrolase